MSDKKRIAVLMGGISTEHEISLETGTTVTRNLDRDLYHVTPVIIQKDGMWLIGKDDLPASGNITNEHLVSTGANPVPMEQAVAGLSGMDAVFIALHGPFGEDGTVQRILGNAGIAYTGSGVESSALAMDKIASMEVYRNAGMLVADWIPVRKGDDTSNIGQQVHDSFGFPCFIKPSEGGSSAATFLLQDDTELDASIEKGFEVADNLIIQEYTKGDEVTCAVLDTDEAPIALPPTQIIPKTSEFFDFQAKYEKGASDEITPPRLPANVIEQIQQLSLKAHELLGCSGLSRTDMIVVEDNIYLLETNTIPGMTATSLYPQAAEKIGLSFSQLLDKLINKAMEQ